MAISMLKIRRPLGRLIFNMGIAIPGKTVFLIETDPWCFGIPDYWIAKCGRWGLYTQIYDTYVPQIISVIIDQSLIADEFNP